MSIYEDIRKIVAIVDSVERLEEANTELVRRVAILEREVAELRGRQEAIVLASEKAARETVLRALNGHKTDLTE